MDEVKTRSQWVHEPSPLDEIFGKANAEEFVDALHGIPDLIFTTDESEALARKIVKGEPDQIFVPKPLVSEVSRFVRITHGWHNNDYVWHFEPASIRRPWNVHEDDVLYRIALIMHENLPEIEAKLWLPEFGWELRTITFKAIDARSHWGFQESRVSLINSKLFEVLNTVV